MTEIPVFKAGNRLPERQIIASRPGASRRRDQGEALAAHREGIREAILPRDNKADLKDLPKNVAQDMTIHLIETMDEVFKNRSTREMPSVQTPPEGGFDLLDPAGEGEAVRCIKNSIAGAEMSTRELRNNREREPGSSVNRGKRERPREYPADRETREWGLIELEEQRRKSFGKSRPRRACRPRKSNTKKTAATTRSSRLEAQAKKQGPAFSEGVLETPEDGFGFLRAPEFSHSPSQDDIWLSRAPQIRNSSPAPETRSPASSGRPRTERSTRLDQGRSCELYAPFDVIIEQRRNVHFEQLTPLYPFEMIKLQDAIPRT